MYVYIQSERTLWTVGHYTPAGDWRSESDHDTTEAAAARVHYLNGGANTQCIRDLTERVEAMEGANSLAESVALYKEGLA